MILVVSLLSLTLTTPAPTPPVQESIPTSPLVVSGVSAALAAVVIVSGTFAWWRDEGYVGWSWRDTGFFGQKTYAGGSDKAGHFYTCYLGTRMATQIYEWVGLPHGVALAMGASMGFFLSNVVEAVDGFTPFGFEWADALANSIGIALAMVFETWPTLDGLFGARMGYVQTLRFFTGKVHYFKLINDYSGMIFYLDLKPAGLEALGVSPGVFRYVNFGFSFGTDGYRPQEKPRFRKRNVGVHVGLEIPAILETLFGADAPGVDVARRTTKYYALPFTTIMLNHDLNQGGQAVNFGLANRAQVAW